MPRRQRIARIQRLIAEVALMSPRRARRRGLVMMSTRACPEDAIARAEALNL
jgi:hypothetical protein